jgi:hypothetical protein
MTIRLYIRPGRGKFEVVNLTGIYANPLHDDVHPIGHTLVSPVAVDTDIVPRSQIQ